MRILLASCGLMLCSAVALAQDNIVATGESVTPSNDWYNVFTLPGQNSATTDNNTVVEALGLENTYQSFRLYSTEKWLVNLDIATRPDQTLDIKNNPRENAAAEAYYRMTPSWTVGGSFSVGMDELDDTGEWKDQRLQAGIRLESAFRF